MYKISKQFHFSASHQLHQLPDNHPCARLHGHNYIVRVDLQSEQLDQHGFIIDYGDLLAFKQYIDNTLDHRHLNDVFEFHPTAENMAKHLYLWCKSQWPQTIMVFVSETSKTNASYSEVTHE